MAPQSVSFRHARGCKLHCLGSAGCRLSKQGGKAEPLQQLHKIFSLCSDCRARIIDDALAAGRVLGVHTYGSLCCLKCTMQASSKAIVRNR